MRSVAIFLTVLFTMASAGAAYAGPTAAQKCQALKEKGAGKHGQCHAKANSKGVSKAEVPDPLAQVKCNDKTTKTFDKAELKGGVECLTTGDAPAISAALQTCADDATLLITDGNLPGGGILGKCDSKKIKAAGGYLSCKYKARSKSVIKGEAADFTKCNDKLSKLITKANTGVCSTSGDLAPIQTAMNNCFEANTLNGIYGATTAISDVTCTVLGIVPVSLPVQMTLTPMQRIEVGTTVDVDIDVSVVIDEATSDFLVGLLIGAMLPTEATIDGATISTSASAGADSPNSQDSVFTGPLLVDLTADPDMNGMTGPHVFPTPTIMTSYDVSLAATSLDIAIDEVEVFLTALALPLMLSTDPGAVPPGGETLTICALTPGTVSFPVQ